MLHIVAWLFQVVFLSVLKAKPDLNTTLPVRQTASIFKQPVTKVTNHPNNKVKTDPQKAVDQPRQVRRRGETPVLSRFRRFLFVVCFLLSAAVLGAKTEWIKCIRYRRGADEVYGPT